MRSVAIFVLLLLVFAIPWENAVTVEGIGTLTRVIGIAAAAAWLGSVLFSGEIRKPHLFHVLVGLLVSWIAFGLFWTVGYDATVACIKTAVQLALLAWILWDLVRTPETLGAAMQAYILGAYVSAGSVIIRYLAGPGAYASIDGRYTGANLNENDLALILALGLPVAWHLAVSAGRGARSRVLKWVNFAYIPVALFAIISTGSRMALFAVAPALFYIVGTARQIKPSLRILILAALIGSLFAMQSYIPQSALSRLGTAFDSIANRDLGGRVWLWRVAAAVFMERPFLGVGAGALRVPAILGAAAHNTFLSVLAELGLVGFVLFVSILATVGIQVVRRPNQHTGLWLTVLAIWAIGVSTLSWEYTKPTWLFLGLAVVSASLWRQADQAALQPQLPSGLGSAQLRYTPRTLGSRDSALEHPADGPNPEQIMTGRVS